MTSDIAISEIEAMQAEGLAPTVADIVRLNALALVAERGPDACAFYSMRRAVRLAPDVYIQEPTIAHELYLARCLKTLGRELPDMEFVALRIWVCQLPDDAVDQPPPEREKLQKTIDAFLAGPLRRVSLRQAVDAATYCIYGLSHRAQEYAACDDGDAPPEDFSPEIALVSRGVSLGLGLSLADARRMTYARLAAIVQRAADARIFDSPDCHKILRERQNAALDAFSRTADEIRARLKADATAKNTEV